MFWRAFQFYPVCLRLLSFMPPFLSTLPHNNTAISYNTSTVNQFNFHRLHIWIFHKHSQLFNFFFTCTQPLSLGGDGSHYGLAIGGTGTDLRFWDYHLVIVAFCRVCTSIWILNASSSYCVPAAHRFSFFGVNLLKSSSGCSTFWTSFGFGFW